MREFPAPRAAALAILAVLMALVYVGPVSSYAALVRADGQKLAAARAALKRDRATVAEGPGRGARGETILFPAMSDAEAAARLQELLKAAARAAAVEIRDMQVLDAEPVDGARRVGVRLEASGDIAGIERLVYTIEAARPVLYPDNLHVESASLPGTPAGALQFEIEVSGFMPGAS